ISHITGIPHSPMGQAPVEWAHQTIKRMLFQQKGGVEIETPAVWLARALFTLSFFNCSEKEPDSPVLCHFHNTMRAWLKEHPLVLTKEPDSLKITSPFPLI
ncbi:IGEB protein, partial [Myiagra hebetior]|nr:IGEB protein [Myiagra hebetior]